MQQRRPKLRNQRVHTSRLINRLRAVSAHATMKRVLDDVWTYPGSACFIRCQESYTTTLSF